MIACTSVLLQFTFALLSLPFVRSQWTLVQNGTSGVASMQLAIVSPTLAIILDKVESNPLQIGNHSAWGALWNMKTNTATPLEIVSNSFCAGGTFLSNGTLLSMGGNGIIDPQWGDTDGSQGIRLFGPCTSPTGVGCTVFEDPSTLALAAIRWYPTALRIFDGSALIMGGTSAGGFTNNVPGANTNSYEFFPQKNGGVPIESDFLGRTVPANLFPIALGLPDGTVFIAANNQTIIYNIQTNTETALPELPNGVRVTYPFSGSGVLLPLSPPNYIPEVLICGGSNISDSLDPSLISSQTPASSQCVRMVLNSAGIANGWQVEQMLENRMMPELVLLPNGQILLVNGCQTGVAGYGNVFDPVGQSNCDNPAFTPSLYTPSAAAGSRFSNAGLPTSSIARLYHSVATVTPMGNIMISGSNPNADFSTIKYATEYRVEYLNPPYMSLSRPAFVKPPTKILFGQSVSIKITVPSGLSTSSIQLALMDLGFTTHATHSQGRLVFLTTTFKASTSTLTVTGPPSNLVYPPGPGWLFLTIGGVTSTGAQIMVGSGGNPPVTS